MKYLLFFSLFAGGCIAIGPTTRLEFEAPDAYPEGIAFDSSSNVYYVTSARTAALGRVSPEGNYSVLFADTMMKSSYGVKVHPDGKRIFFCVADANYSKYTSPETQKKMSRLISVDKASGKKLWDVDFSGFPGKHFANDIAFDNAGNTYVTDSYAHVIYKCDAQGKASVFAKSKMFETEGVGLNGIVFHPSGYLLASNSNKGSFYKIEIANPQNVQKIAIDQYFMGADGLVLNDNNHLTVVVNGGTDKIYQLESTDDWKTAQLSASTLVADRFTYPSTATRNGSDIWVMNAKFSELVDSNSTPSKMFAIQKAVLKPLPKSK